MWTRAELKEKAKNDFKSNYWPCVLVSLIAAFIVGGSGGSAANSTSNATSSGGSYGYGMADSTVIAMVMAIVAIVGIIIIAGIVLGVFVFNPLLVGCRRFYEENQLTQAKISTVGFGFKNGRYGNITMTMFLRDLFIVLWALLFFIPGIIKSYSYYMIEYILAENPSIDRNRAFEISKNTMNGQKWNTFVLELSFFGWYLLGAITCGIVGVFYVNPYVDATKTRLYEALRMQALQNGIATPEELPGIAV